ncbi:hypothetical protein H5410_021327 [Solanum commersonii]|uniref:Disease resistance protein n=1 Tax=Solanum commersonii TaxID=4109 RepID=A0A9J5ZGV0_SOLCO|nr:hypothetical protein H5410_021327 [Solanum commersonii]
MEAYTAVISLLRTLDQPYISQLFLDHIAETLDSLRVTAEYFQQLLEKTSNEKIKYFEEEIRVVVSEAEDVVEMKISKIIKGESWTFGILQHQDMLPIVSHDVDQILELTGDSLIGASSMSMGGIGKTTLAKKVYDYLPIRYHFDIFVWVTISQEFQYRNVLLEVLNCIPNQNAQVYVKLKDNELADLVQKNLKGPRYLVVVDDIWDSISQIFPNRNNDSRILLTTRETEVAMYANTSTHHEMNLLDLDNSWKLLCNKVFGLEHDHPIVLEKNGKKIVEKCQGLPLIISVIAGHLSKTAKTLKSWELTQLWIAEGFIRAPVGSRKSLEEVEKCYLEDLISRNLIMARKRRFNGEVKVCGIHDLLREFCFIEAEMTKFMHVVRTPFSPTQKPNFRRFSIQKAFLDEYGYKQLPPVARSMCYFSLLDLPFEPRIKLLRILPIYCHDPIIHGFFSRFNLLKGDSYLPSPRIDNKMPNLEELFSICYSSCTNEVFSSIPNLKRLTIRVPLSVGDNIPSQLIDMSNLRKLESIKFNWILPFKNPINIFAFTTSLRTLSLTDCANFIWKDISSTFIMFPNLEELKLKSCRAEDDVWRLSDKDIFKSLKLLLLKYPNLKCWEASSDNFPNLKRLVLKNCNNLQEIPTDFGEICTLQSIELHNCSTSADESAINIVQEQEEMGNNILKVYISHGTMVNFLVDNVLQLLSENVSLIKAGDVEFNNLLKEVRCLKEFVDDAWKYHSDSKQWDELVRDIQLTLFKAEDAIDEFVIQSKLNREKNKIGTVFGKVSHISNVRALVAEIKEIHYKVKKFRENNLTSFSVFV